MNRLIKLMSVTLCLTILLSASLVGVLALTRGSAADETDDAPVMTLAAAAAAEEEVQATLYKSESVYVIAGADGKVERIIVSDWIKNPEHAETITDFSVLGDIQNVKGYETYTLNADNMCVWQAAGKDLYLRGDGKEPLPVDLSLSYTLDGAPIAPDELVGKSGDITIRFDYKNNAYEDVEIDGVKTRIYVPFMMLSGLLLDTDVFSDVTVTNGKVISDGDRCIVAGIAFPGLTEDLGLTGGEFSLPEYVEIHAHAENFSLGTTITIATNSLVNKIDASKLDSLDSLKDSVKQLTDAMTALTDGSSQLYTGLNTLLEKSEELTAGIDALYDGASQLSDGAAQLSQGAADLNSGAIRIDSGMISLSEGLSTLSYNNDALVYGSDQTFLSILSTARNALIEQGLDVPELTPDNYAAVLDGIINNLSEENATAMAQAAAKEQVTATVEANRAAVEAAVTEAVRANVRAEVEAGVRAQVTAGVLATLGYSAEDYAAAVEAGLVGEDVQAQVNGAVEAQMGSDEVVGTIDALTEENMQSDQVQAIIRANTADQILALIDQNMQSDAVQTAIAEGVAKAQAGAAAVQALKEQLDNYAYFNSGLKAYTSGVASASDGASQLSAGAGQLKDGTAALKDGSASLADGAVKLRDGILTLKDGVPALTEGVSKLRDGAMQISDGLKRFSEEGVGKLVALLDGDISGIAKRLKATLEVSARYKSYTGLTDEMDGDVKFIYRTDGLTE